MVDGSGKSESTNTFCHALCTLCYLIIAEQKDSIFMCRCQAFFCTFEQYFQISLQSYIKTRTRSTESTPKTTYCTDLY